MRYLQFAKRIIPFVVTFAVGLFIASFFVALSAPKFEGKSNWKRYKHGKLRKENRRLKKENRRLKKENCRLKHKMRVKERRVYLNEVRIDIPAPPVAPIPPIAPIAPNKARLEARKAVKEALDKATEKVREATR